MEPLTFSEVSTGVIYNYQTLIAGGAALLAALIAAKPVYRQLHAMQIQVAIASREHLGARAGAIATRRNDANGIVESITTRFLSDIYRGDDQPPDIQPEWAHNAEMVVENAVARLQEQRMTFGDGEDIINKRNLLVQSTKELAVCLRDIYLPHTGWLEDPENEWTKEQEDAAKAKADAAALNAEKELESKIGAVTKAGKQLDQAYESELTEIRNKIVKINKLVLKQ